MKDERQMTDRQRKNLNAQLLKGRRRASELMALTEEVRNSLHGSKTQELARINNVLEFICLYDFEFSCLLEDLLAHETTLRGNVYARHLILLIYETSEKLRHLLGHEFQEDMKAIGYSQESITTVRGILKCFNDAFERCNRKFGDVRDGAVAHRDWSAATQVALLRKVQPNEVADVAIEMEGCVLKLHGIMHQHSQNLRKWIEASA